MQQRYAESVKLRHPELLNSRHLQNKTKGSGGYVAIERVTDKLHGRSGTFLLQHGSTMTRGVPHQSVSVIPDSGTGELTDLTGKMTINITDSNHSYDFEYALETTNK